MRKVIPVAVVTSALLLFVAVNIYASQMFHPLMYQIIPNTTPSLQEAAIRQYLLYIEDTPEFESQYAYYNNLYGNIFAKEDFEEEYSLNNEIEKYKKMLDESAGPAPKLLAKIALIYFDKGDKAQAQHFYAQAKAIDPWIKIEELEGL